MQPHPGRGDLGSCLPPSLFWVFAPGVTFPSKVWLVLSSSWWTRATHNKSLHLANLIYFEVITFIFFPMLVGELSLSTIRLQSSWVWNAKMNNLVLKVPVVAFLEVSICLCLEVFIAYAADVGWIGSSEPFLSQVFGTRSTGLAIRGSSIGRHLKIKTYRVWGHYACHISLR